MTDEKFYRLDTSSDKGRGLVTGKKEDDFKFRTPSLRNVAIRGPYMHDGRFKSLSEVAFFYFRGVPRLGPDGLPLDVESLQGVPFMEMSDLLAFLEALTGKQLEIVPPELP